MPTTTVAATPGPASPGRPRDPRRDEAIRDAVLTLLGDVGYERMSVDAIAASAGVSKPTIYRRWPGKHALVADAIRCHPHVQATAPDTGSLRGDLLAAVAQSAGQQLESARLVAGLVGRTRESDELAELVREHAVEAVRRRFRALLDRAAQRGELPDAAAVSPLFADVAPSLIHSRVLLSVEPVDDAFAVELVDHVLLPIVAAAHKPEEHLGTVLRHA
jgi:AcrR family transcriptional regulator